MATMMALKTSMTLLDLLDVLEAKAVRDSWTHAELLNHDQIRDRKGRLDKALAKRRAQ